VDTELEISKLGNILDKLKYSLVVLDETLNVKYSNQYAKTCLDRRQSKSNNTPCPWRLIPGVISRKKVFFLLDRDVSHQQEVWVKLQLESDLN